MNWREKDPLQRTRKFPRKQESKKLICPRNGIVLSRRNCRGKIITNSSLDVDITGIVEYRGSGEEKCKITELLLAHFNSDKF